jgi:LysR family nitrogen assimilation transcriptional regulator
MGLELTVTYEVRSISAMKNLALKGVAGSVLPFASVSEEVRNGLLDARPIAMPPIRRTLYLVSSSQGPELRSDAAVTVAVRESIAILLELLGPLAHPLWIRAS